MNRPLPEIGRGEPIFIGTEVRGEAVVDVFDDHGWRVEQPSMHTYQGMTSEEYDLVLDEQAAAAGSGDAEQEALEEYEYWHGGDDL